MDAKKKRRNLVHFWVNNIALSINELHLTKKSK